MPATLISTHRPDPTAYHGGSGTAHANWTRSRDAPWLQGDSVHASPGSAESLGAGSHDQAAYLCSRSGQPCGVSGWRRHGELAAFPSVHCRCWVTHTTAQLLKAYISRQSPSNVRCVHLCALFVQKFRVPRRSKGQLQPPARPSLAHPFPWQYAQPMLVRHHHCVSLGLLTRDQTQPRLCLS